MGRARRSYSPTKVIGVRLSDEEFIQLEDLVALHEGFSDLAPGTVTPSAMIRTILCRAFEQARRQGVIKELHRSPKSSASERTLEVVTKYVDETFGPLPERMWVRDGRAEKPPKRKVRPPHAR